MAEGLPGGPRVAAPLAWGVAPLLLAARDALGARFGAVSVRGELSAVTRAASGHLYFTLKDDAGAPALLRVAMFRRGAALLDFVPAEGQKVELRGRLEIYEARGELQLVAEAMQRVGAGTLYEEFLRLRARLQAQGLFDAARKRPLPREPRVLGVVSSLAAAALQDVLAALARRAPHVRVVVYPTPVQGAEAPPAIVAALQAAVLHGQADALLLVRGGGSLEDLWAFNDERVVRAIVACPLPLVCGVGHETDITLADLAADLRAPTPTAAAELAATPRDELLSLLRSQEARLVRAVERTLAQRAQRLDQLALRLGAPARALLAQRQQLVARAQRLAHALVPALAERRRALELTELRLRRAVERALVATRHRLHAQALRLAAQDPAAPLARGYAWVEDAQGRPIVSARSLQRGQRITAQWADGRAAAEIAEIVDKAPAKPPQEPPRP